MAKKQALQDQVYRKFSTKYGFDATCKNDIQTYVEDYIENKRKTTLQLNRNDLQKIEKEIKELPSVSAQIATNNLRQAMKLNTDVGQAADKFFVTK